MTTLRGLFLKDLLILKSYSRNILICLVLFSILIVSQAYDDDMSYIGAIMIMLVFSMTVLSTFSYDEKSNADRYILTLPISRKEIVKEKYILSITSLIIGAIVGSIINMALMYFATGKIPNIEETLIGIMSGMVGVALIQAIQMPCIYKWGAEKGRLQIYIIAMAIFVIGILLSTFFPTFEITSGVLSLLNKFLPIICVCLISIIYFISYKISYKIYIKKEV